MTSIFNAVKQALIKQPTQDGVSSAEATQKADTAASSAQSTAESQAGLLDRLHQMQENRLKTKLDTSTQNTWSMYLESYLARVLSTYHNFMPEGHSVMALIMDEPECQLLTPISRKGVPIPYVFITPQGSSFFTMGEEGKPPVETMEGFTMMMDDLHQKGLFQYKVVGLSVMHPTEGWVKVAPALVLEPVPPTAS